MSRRLAAGSPAAACRRLGRRRLGRRRLGRRRLGRRWLRRGCRRRLRGRRLGRRRLRGRRLRGRRLRGRRLRGRRLRGRRLRGRRLRGRRLRGRRLRGRWLRGRRLGRRRGLAHPRSTTIRLTSTHNEMSSMRSVRGCAATTEGGPARANPATAGAGDAETSVDRLRRGDDRPSTERRLDATWGERRMPSWRDQSRVMWSGVFRTHARRLGLRDDASRVTFVAIEKDCASTSWPGEEHDRVHQQQRTRQATASGDRHSQPRH